MTRALRGAALTTGAALTSLIALGCSGGPSATPPSLPASTATAPAPAPSADTLAAVSLPDLSSTARPVEAQIRARFDALIQVRASSASASAQAGSYGDLGNYFLAATFFDEAALCYGHAAALEPNDPRWPYLRGHASLRKGDRDAAATAFERAVALRADYVPALVWLGDVYLDLGRVGDAQGTFARALVREPESASGLFGAGRAALARGAYAAAASYMEHARRVDPRATSINYSLAMAYRGAGQAEKAEPLLKQRGTAAPALVDPMLQEAEVVLDSATSYEGLGMQALRRQDWAGAVQAFRRGLEVAPADASLRYWMATAMAASGDATGAEREFQSAVRARPDLANAHFSLGAMLDRRGQKAGALREYQAAVNAAPTMPEARLRLADTLRAQGQSRAAVEQYTQAVTLDPTLGDAWIGGAQALIASGQKEAAKDWLARAMRLHPNRRELVELNARIR